MPPAITSAVVVAYAQCPRKASLPLFNPDKGEPHEYVQILKQQRCEHQESYIDHLKHKHADVQPYAWENLHKGSAVLINTHLQVDGFAAVCIVRGKAGLHPRVLNAFREDGPRITSCQDRDFQALLATLPQRPRTELEVAWLIEHAPLRLRLLVSGHPETKSLADLFTNLPHTRYPINTRCLGYKLRS